MTKQSSSFSRELHRIKKKYGEKMMHFCRDHFPTILEEEGELLKILDSTFANNAKGLWEDITQQKQEIEFEDLILSRYYPKKNERSSSKRVVTHTPFELMEAAGYDLYECKTNSEAKAFCKYYSEKYSEVLCTFSDYTRVLLNFVFFAVKKNVDEIKRDAFPFPKREDEYGTSVLSIQFRKKSRSTVSIICRYNHSVENPNGTYHNHLNKIVPGLEESFAQLLEERGYHFAPPEKSDFELRSYTKGSDGRWYKYSFKWEDRYICPGNIVIEKKTGKTFYMGSPEKVLLVEYFLFDFQNKKVTTLKDTIQDAFVDDLTDIEQMYVIRNKTSHDIRTIYIQKKGCNDCIQVVINPDNRIIGYDNNQVKKIDYGFLKYSNQLQELGLSNVKIIGDDFLYYNSALKSLLLPSVVEIGNCFMKMNVGLQYFEAPLLEKTGVFFLQWNHGLTSLRLPSLKEISYYFLEVNTELQEITVPCLNLEMYTRAGYFSEVLMKENWLHQHQKEIGTSLERENESSLSILEQLKRWIKRWLP